MRQTFHLGSFLCESESMFLISNVGVNLTLFLSIVLYDLFLGELEYSSFRFRAACLFTLRKCFSAAASLDLRAYSWAGLVFEFPTLLLLSILVGSDSKGRLLFLNFAWVFWVVWSGEVFCGCVGLFLLKYHFCVSHSHWFRIQWVLMGCLLGLVEWLYLHFLGFFF